MCLELSRGSRRPILDPDELLDLMPEQLFEEWRVYDRIEPFGDWHIIQTIGRLIQVTIGMHRSPGDPPVELDQCVPTVDTEALWQEIEESMEEHRRLASMTQAEIDAEAMRNFEAAHRARMGQTPT